MWTISEPINLRQVKVKMLFPIDKEKYGEEEINGYFHKFATYRDEDGEGNYALVELESGDIIETAVTYIRFVDWV